MSTFWSIFIIVLVVINVGGCLWLIAWTMNMKTDEESDDSEKGQKRKEILK